MPLIEQRSEEDTAAASSWDENETPVRQEPLWLYLYDRPKWVGL